MPPTVQWAAAELMLGANPAAFLYLAGPSFAAVIHDRGTPEQRRWAKLMIERGWGATHGAHRAGRRLRRGRRTHPARCASRTAAGTSKG